MVSVGLVVYVRATELSAVLKAKNSSRYRIKI